MSPTPAQAAVMFRRASFRVMTKYDLSGFEGCESPCPMMAESGDYLLILDGDVVDFLNVNTDENDVFPVAMLKELF